MITPNLQEAAALLGAPVARNEDETKDQARGLLALGPSAVLIKGGHGIGPEATDLFFDGNEFRTFSAPRLATANTHGTGCTLASAITAFLVKGLAIEAAIAEAKTYLQGALQHANGLAIGAGAGPVSHFYRARSATV